MSSSGFCTIDFSKVDWNRISPEECNQLIYSELTETEIAEIDMRALGNIVYRKTFVLSRRVNEELLEPISKWLDDAHFMDKFKIILEDQIDWSKYKREQRQWTAQQKLLAAERLKLYWQAIRKKKDFHKEASKLFGRSSPRASPKIQIEEDFITPILAPFSPPEIRKELTELEFKQALGLSVSDLLPWKLLITSELTETKKLSDLNQYYDDSKKDTASKLIHLLHLEQEGKLTMNQEETFSDIIIEPLKTNHEKSITIKDQQGRDYQFDWQYLSGAQKNKVIADIKDHRIICRCE